jgi:hypothetical protein
MQQSDFPNKAEWLAYLNTSCPDNPETEQQRKSDKALYYSQVLAEAIQHSVSVGASTVMTLGPVFL